MISIIKKHLPFPVKYRLVSALLYLRRKVDFAIVGFPKCATTSIGGNISDAPGVFLPSHEIQVRNMIFSKLDRGKKDDLIGIRNPNLIYEMHNLAALISRNPRIRLIISLRDPASWLYSFFQYRRLEIENNAQWLRRHVNTSGLKDIRFDDIVYKGQSLMGADLQKGNFIYYIQSLLKYAEPDQILILFMEELSKDPGKTYEKIFRFLNLDYDSVPAEPIKANIHNASYEPKSMYRNQLEYADVYYGPMKKELNALLERQWGIKNTYW